MLGDSTQLLGAPVDVYAAGLALFELTGDSISWTSSMDDAAQLQWKQLVVRLAEL